MAAATVIVAGCGRGDPGGTEKIAGADTSTGSAGPTASAAADDVERPTVKLPGSVKNVFEGPRTGEVTKDAVLADSERGINAESDAIVRGTPTSAALRFYNKGESLLSEAKYVRSFLDAGISYKGTIRYFDRRVTVVDDRTATLVYCADESGAANTDRRTGVTKKSGQTKPDDNYVLYNTRLTLNSKGVWQSTKGFSKRGADACLPR
ncbi:hypothetical protein AB0Q95_33170 [Streptomyces sp. NPDC059900]|uniref:hypothetical protein n=1 Tax=Streptomyces sp. NPDC059900 TaxID=3155816 RepID=UPI003412B8BD